MPKRERWEDPQEDIMADILVEHRWRAPGGQIYIFHLALVFSKSGILPPEGVRSALLLTEDDIG